MIPTPDTRISVELEDAIDHAVSLALEAGQRKEQSTHTTSPKRHDNLLVEYSHGVAMARAHIRQAAQRELTEALTSRDEARQEREALKVDVMSLEAARDDWRADAAMGRFCPRIHVYSLTKDEIDHGHEESGPALGRLIVSAKADARRDLLARVTEMVERELDPHDPAVINLLEKLATLA